MLFQVVLILFSFISSYVLSFLPLLWVPTIKKVSLWRRKIGKEKISLSRESRQEEENRRKVMIYFFVSKKGKSPGIEITETLSSSHTYTSSPPPFLSGPGWLAPSGRHVGACFAAEGCCSTWQSSDTMLPGDALCKHRTGVSLPLSVAKQLLLVGLIFGKTLLTTSGEALPHTHTGARAQRQLNTPGCTCSKNYLLWLSLN